MTDESIHQLERAALAFAQTHTNPHESLQEHVDKCAAASALLIAAALEIAEDELAEPSD